MNTALIDTAPSKLPAGSFGGALAIGDIGLLFRARRGDQDAYFGDGSGMRPMSIEPERATRVVRGSAERNFA
jgi:hypothetical protein